MHTQAPSPPSFGASTERTSDPSGLVVVHGNRAERLLEVAAAWQRLRPTAPLEMQTWIVPSQGVAQWVRQTLAQGPDGIAAGLALLLPAQWLWQTYRSVLGAAAVPDRPVLDEGPLAWRLWRLLPTLHGEPFGPLQAYLALDGDGTRRAQLAQRLADLYDQYQVYRPDWLDDWAAGRDVLRPADGPPQPLPAAQRWQAALWRAVQADLAASGVPTEVASRPALHAAFVAAMRRPAAARPPGLPARLVVFGLTGLPPATLEALALVARWCEVLVCVLNPCCEYWADIVPDAQWLTRASARWRERAALRSGAPAVPAPLPDDGLASGHPLLAAWGRQGRDFIALLLAHEERPVRDRLDAALQALGRGVDLFESPLGPDGTGPLLAQLQDDILHNRPLAEIRARQRVVDPAADASLRFHVCHTALREVEVLHDQILAALHRDPTLAPRDVLVMVPDVATYAPLVHAVFGRLAADDPRHVPYTISDAADDAGLRVWTLVRDLCRLPHSRLTLAEVLGWLDVPAFARRFALTPPDIERLRAWLHVAGVRWGLDARHRRRLGLVGDAPDPGADDASEPATAHRPDDADRLTWRDGLRRLWAGYAMGALDDEWQGVLPAPGVAPLEAALIERLERLVATLERHAEALAPPAPAAQWTQRLQGLLDDCLLADAPAADRAETRALQRLRAALAEWAEDAAAAGDEPLPLAVVADAWLARAKPEAPGQRFLAGKVTFATLLPMRALPFRRIYLLGMGDGAYPRQRPTDDFDLMALHPRPGDRLHRHEDQYLFLEALLSAREHLSVSWVGRSPVDDAALEPSVLVQQLRDHLAAGWRLADGDGDALLRALTTHHRLQPFDAQYYPPLPPEEWDAPPEGPWFSYAHEWLAAPAASTNAAPSASRTGSPAASPAASSAASPAPSSHASTPPAWQPPTAIDIDALIGFLRHPARAFFQQRLRVHLGDDEEPEDEREPLTVDGLDRWQMDDAWVARVVQATRAGGTADEALAQAEAVWRRAVLAGRWPAGPFGEAMAGDWRDEVPRLWRAVRAFEQRYAEGSTRPRWLHAPPRGDAMPVAIEAVLPPPRRAPDGERAQLLWQGSALIEDPKAKKQGAAAIRYAKLAKAWVWHLAQHRAGEPLATWVLSPRGSLLLPPLEAEAATAAWEALLHHWWQGMQRPCPYVPELAAGFLRRLDDDAPDQAWWDARRAYEGQGEHRQGIVERDAYWRLAYPDFTALAGPPDQAADSPLRAAAEALLRPLMLAARSLTNEDLHAGAEASA
ncbi:exodeoxyribonuclease V subunit gamma [Tepidimonas taiwanensis]|uniref:exodeoxyribonuclease V subunit gamma n=1 Tax=Tepidimonas taiwanensis TaxID=307486 RepID=UPI000AD118FC|nr:exodeoxyribonuclease V subunit gamma [Tepidimonas taiwanensis]